MWLCGVLLALPVWASIASPGTIAPEPTNPVPMTAAELRHASTDHVRMHLGSPIAITVEGNAMTWAYLAIDGKRVDDALRFENDRVVATSSATARLVPSRSPDGQPALGTALRTLVAGHGEPIAITPRAPGTEHRFRDGTRVVIAHGVVVSIPRD